MKKIYFVCLLLTGFILNANAQFYVGGTTSLSYSNMKNTNDNSISAFQFNLAPEFGYYFHKNIGVGAAIGGSIKTMTDVDATKEFFVNPYLRFSSKLENIANLFADVSYQFATTKQSDGRDVNYSKVALRPGVGILIGKHLKGTLRTEWISYTSNNSPIDGVKTKFNLAWNPNLTWGLEYDF